MNGFLGFIPILFMFIKAEKASDIFFVFNAIEHSILLIFIRLVKTNGGKEGEELNIIGENSWLHTELIPHIYHYVVTAHEGGKLLMKGV